jgi:hypothetical protein
MWLKLLFVYKQFIKNGERIALFLHTILVFSEYIVMVKFTQAWRFLTIIGYAKQQINIFPINFRNYRVFFVI